MTPGVLTVIGIAAILIVLDALLRKRGLMKDRSRPVGTYLAVAWTSFAVIAVALVVVALL